MVHSTEILDVDPNKNAYTHTYTQNLKPVYVQS